MSSPNAVRGASANRAARAWVRALLVPALVAGAFSAGFLVPGWRATAGRWGGSRVSAPSKAVPPVAAAARPPSHAAAPIRNVLVYLIDTLRADHVGCYGYFRDTTPTLDRLAAGGVVFENASATSSWTRPTVVSLFTGMYPVAHGVLSRDDSACDELVMMAELFRDRGFRTVGYSSNVSISAKTNTAQGFDEFTLFDPQEWQSPSPQRKHPGFVPVEGMIAAPLEWLSRVGDQPFFMYFHCTDPHAPYYPPPETALWQPDNAYNRYDGCIRNADAHLEKLLNHLSSLGKLEETLIIVTADHGEEWAEHQGAGHGFTLYREQLHIPLILAHPSLGATRRAEPVRQVDLLPTLVELCGLPGAAAPPIQGRSLVPLLRGESDPRPEEQFVLADIANPRNAEASALARDGWKVIWIAHSKPSTRLAAEKTHVLELYHVERGESVNLAAVEPERARRMRAEMDALRQRLGSARMSCEKRGVDEQADRMLRTLGYLGDDDASPPTSRPRRRLEAPREDGGGP